MSEEQSEKLFKIVLYAMLVFAGIFAVVSVILCVIGITNLIKLIS